MKDSWIAARREQLYKLLPSIYQVMDQAITPPEQKGPLQELLGVITEQVNLLEDDLARWYDNLFIETCEDWVLPYLGDLVGYESGLPGHETPDAPESTINLSVVFPRREIADTVALRRRKGSLALLEEISRRVVGWPARAVEYRRTTAGTASLNHLRVRRSSSVDLRNGDALDRLDTPFDLLPRMVDLRRINSRHTVGRHNLQNIGLFVCRRKIDSVTLAPIGFQNEGRATFDLLGLELPLHVLPQPEESAESLADLEHLPVPLTKQMLRAATNSGDDPTVFLGANSKYYGLGNSLFLVAKYEDGTRLIPAGDIYVTELNADRNFPLDAAFCDKVAIDPESGRIAFHPDYQPQMAWATYHVGRVALFGGGEYKRNLSKGTVTHQVTKEVISQGANPIAAEPDVTMERVLSEAKRSWETSVTNQKFPEHSVIEIIDNEEYVAEIDFCVPKGKTLEIRAANFYRPVLRVPDTLGGSREACRFSGEPYSHLILDGLIFSQGVIQIEGQFASVTIRHCTLVPDRAQLEIRLNGSQVKIEKSIMGPISIRPADVRPQDAPRKKKPEAAAQPATYQEPIELLIKDSIVNGRDDVPDDIAVGYAIAGRKLEANLKGAGGARVSAEFTAAHAVLNIQRSTVLGEISALEVGNVSDSLLVDQVCIDNCQRGCVRYSYLPGNSCTPSPYQCQPADTTCAEPIRPVFISTKFGHPDYMRLSDTCPAEILVGAEDQGEMGVYHDEYFSLRAAHLKRRIQEFIPAGNEAGILFET